MSYSIEGSTPVVDTELHDKIVDIQGAEVGGFVVATLALPTETPGVVPDVYEQTAQQGNTVSDDIH